MRKLRVVVEPHLTTWRFNIYTWVEEAEAKRRFRDDAVEGWYDALLLAPPGLEFYELQRCVEGKGFKNEERARKAARYGLKELAGHLALQEFDDQVAAERGYTVELGG